MANQTTKIADLINPEVMADMISAKVDKKMVVTPIAKIDMSLVGTPGSTITVPSYNYIGDAEDVAEGVEAGTTKLTTSTRQVTVKKAMKAVDLTDESVLSGYGNPVGETNNQLAKAIASKIDNDAMDALLTAPLVFDGSSNVISYAQIVDAIDLFNEEVNTEKVMFIAPSQVTALRKDSNFISADKYPNNVMMTGEIGKVANTRIVPSKKVPLYSEWYKFDSAGTATTSANIDVVQVTLPNAKVGDKVTKVTTPCYFNPIVKLNQDAETEDETSALTVYLKRNVNIETERNTLARKTIISVDEHYAAALSDESKVVLAKFKK